MRYTLVICVSVCKLRMSFNKGVDDDKSVTSGMKTGKSMELRTVESVDHRRMQGWWYMNGYIHSDLTFESQQPDSAKYFWHVDTKPPNLSFSITYQEEIIATESKHKDREKEVRDVFLKAKSTNDTNTKYSVKTKSGTDKEFTFEYWILYLNQRDENDVYKEVVIGEPKRKLLWILSRQTCMEEDRMTDLLDMTMKNFGYSQKRISRKLVIPNNCIH